MQANVKISGTVYQAVVPTVTEMEYRQDSQPSVLSVQALATTVVVFEY